MTGKTFDPGFVIAGINEFDLNWTKHISFDFLSSDTKK